MSKARKKAIEAVNQRGALLVFPIKNQPEVPSLWKEFYPRSEMKWEWNEDGDNRISKMWILMKELSVIREVIYVKWFKGRATFFSRPLFIALLKITSASEKAFQNEPRAANLLMEALEEDSPLSTKQLKLLTDLRGRDNEGVYNRALNWLFSRLQIVGYGEADDGAFPSLVVGATKLMYEDLWSEAEALPLTEAEQIINRFMPEDSAFRKFLDRVLKG